MSAEINFPTSLDDATSMPDPTQYDNFDTPTLLHHDVETRQNNAIKAIEAVLLSTGGTITTPTSGSGSPEGVVDGGSGRLYTDSSIDPPSLWVKLTDGGNTGWRQLIA
jgi:hypothetical protein